MIFCVREIWSVRRLQTTAVTLFLSVLLLACAAARAEDGISSRDSLHLAVAADFSEVARRLADDFSAEAGVPVTITSDSSGVLTSKIRDGATFDVFLSADSERPQELIDEGLAVPKPIVYAVGTLALYGPDLDLSADGDALLRSADFATLAIADPETAPYGRAAIQTLNSLGLREALQGKLVIGENVRKTLDLVQSGKAAAGLVAFPDLDARRLRAWVVPERMHDPIDQAMVVLSAARQPELAKQWIVFLTSAPARRIIEEAGFRLP